MRSLSSGEEYEFIWYGKKRQRDTGVGLLIKVNSKTVVSYQEISDSRLMDGFNIRLINAYSPTNVDGSPQQKDAFHRCLRKACNKKKHEKLIVTDDFNAQTGVVYQQCIFDSESIVADRECNDNGSRLKRFCREQRQQTFNHPLEKQNYMVQ